MTRGRGDQGGILTNKRIRDWIKKRKRDRPFFLFVNYLEAHLPYDPPLKYRKEHLSRLPLDDTVSISWAHEFNAGLYDPENIDWRRVRELYEGDVYTEDQLLGELLEILKVNDMYEDSVIIVTSDHGENLGEHHLIEHQFSVHETLLSVPLVVRAPGIIEQGFNHFPVMLTDLFYFIAELASADPVVSKGNKSQLPPSVFKKDFKKNHGSEEKARYIFSEYAGAPEGLLNVLRRLNPELKDDRLKPGFSTITDGTWRLTLDTEGNVLLHNTKEDPLQRTNVINKYPVIAQKLGEEINKVIYKIKSTKHPSRKLDKETKKKLESLGYIH